MSTNKIEYWLKDWRDRYIQFPVNPEGIEINNGYNVQTVDVLALGQVSYVEEPLLRQFSIDVLFPRDYNPSYCEYSPIRSPMEYVNIIEEWRSARRNLRLIVTGTSVSIPVYIDNIDYLVEPAGEPGDIRATISFIESKFPQERGRAKRDEKGVLIPPKVRPDGKDIEKPRSVVFNQGDTLYAIATKYYGSGDKLVDIYNANRGKFPKGLASKPIGERLVLP